MDKQHEGAGVWTNSMEGLVYEEAAWRGWCMKKQQGGAVVKRDLLNLFCPTCPFKRYNSAWHGICKYYQTQPTNVLTSFSMSFTLQ